MGPRVEWFTPIQWVIFVAIGLLSVCLGVFWFILCFHVIPKRITCMINDNTKPRDLSRLNAISFIFKCFGVLDLILTIIAFGLFALILIFALLHVPLGIHY